MIDRDGDRNIVFRCDSCSDGFLETETTVFGDAALEATDRNWSSQKGKDGKWTHTCPACH